MLELPHLTPKLLFDGKAVESGGETFRPQTSFMTALEYIEMGLEHLSDRETYNELEEDQTKQVANEVTQAIMQSHVLAVSGQKT